MTASRRVIRLPATIVIALAAFMAAGVTSGCASLDERGRVPVDLDPCSIERAACRERCEKTAVHTFSCQIRDGVVIHLECECEPGKPVEVEPP